MFAKIKTDTGIIVVNTDQITSISVHDDGSAICKMVNLDEYNLPAGGWEQLIEGARKTKEE